MKANELMIGDWVMVNDVEHTHPLQVAEIFKKSGAYYATLYWDGMPDNVNPEKLTADIDKVLPIPITSEILKKNGFAIKKKWAQIGNFGNSPLIMWHFVDEPVLKNYKHELEVHQNDTGKVHVRIPCEYVHELQHAFKLCGIEKEIVI